MRSEGSESQSTKTDDDPLVCGGFLQSKGAEAREDKMPNASRLKQEFSLELGSFTTVLSGSCIFNKLLPPVARILFLHDKDKIVVTKQTSN